MIDRSDIEIISGKGGNGAISGRREKFVPHGGPDGGDGGDGGSVILRCVDDLRTLDRFRYQHRFMAENGGDGSGKKKHGQRGGDVEIVVPVGTEVWARTRRAHRLADLSRSGERLLIARGGRGGRGNVRFAGSTNQYPVLAEEGDPGERMELRLELKLIADVGVIGAPNAGKSSLLAAVSRARPKIAAYPFTTLEPVLGTIERSGASFVMVDIPGLIEGAHEGAGLGHDFLRHVQRTKVLVHVVDGAEDDPIRQYQKVREELTLHDENLTERPEIVAVNKADIEGVEAQSTLLRRQLGPAGPKVHCISALARTGLDAMLGEVASTLAEQTAAGPATAEAGELPVLTPELVDRPPSVRKDPHGYTVTLRAAVRIAARVNPGDWTARTQLLEQLRRLRVISDLEKAGAGPGDMVKIGKLELEWE